jgi:hypothetical protein
MAEFEVCPGRCLRYSGVEYAAGAIVPDLAQCPELEAAGVIRRVPSAPVRPKPVAKKKAKKAPAKKKAE